MRNAFATRLLERAEKDESILLITGDLGFGVLDEFQRKLPSQFINSGVAEQSMMSMAAGLASQGYRPFVYSIANFPTFRCLEQIRNDVCYMNNPVTIVSVGAGLGYGTAGYSHHAVEDLAIIRALPNIDIYSPCDRFETNFSVDLILSSRDPAYLRLGKGGEPDINSGIPGLIRKPIIHHLGSAGIMCWTGGIGAKVISAADLLRKIGIDATLISVPFLSDETLLEVLSLAQGKPILTIEEHVLRGGFGSWLLEVANDHGYKGDIHRLGVTQGIDKQVGSQEFLLEKSELSSFAICSKFQEMNGAASGI